MFEKNYNLALNPDSRVRIIHDPDPNLLKTGYDYGPLEELGPGKNLLKHRIRNSKTQHMYPVE